MKKLRWVQVPVVLSTVCLAAACSSGGGGSSSSDTTTGGGDQSATTAAPSGTPDQAADTTTANAINLTDADLSGWKSTPADNSGTNDPTNAQIAKCAGAPDPSTVKVVDVNSATYDLNNAEVSSDVTMVKTAGDGQADLAAFKGDKAITCIQQVLASGIKGSLPSGSTLGDVTVTRLADPSGIPDSFAIQASIPVTVPGQGSSTIVSDELGFLVGRAEVGLTDTVTSGTPDQSLEAKLLNTLYSRAKAQSGTA